MGAPRITRQFGALARLGRVGDHSGELHLAGHLPLDAGLAPEFAHTRTLLDEPGVKLEQATRLDRRPKLGVFDRHEIDQLATAREVERLHRENAGRLRQRLDLQHARHDRPTGEVPLEELLVEADRLDRPNLLVDAQIGDLVDEKERVAVRQGLENLRDVVGARGRDLAHGPAPSRPSGPGPAWPAAAAVAVAAGRPAAARPPSPEFPGPAGTTGPTAAAAASPRARRSKRSGRAY